MYEPTRKEVVMTDEGQEKKVAGFNLNRLRTDKTKDLEGVWHDYIDGLKFLIARGTNPQAKAYRNRLLKKNNHLVQSGDVAIIEKITNQVMAKHILLDWENLQDVNDAGEIIEVPYSVEKALELLETVPKFADIIVGMAGDFEAYQLQAEDEDVKN